MPRYPIEAPEGVTGIDVVDIRGYQLPSGAISVTEIEVLDLISEGEIEGLVTGDYFYCGTLGNIGWDSVTFHPYPNAANNDPAVTTSDLKFLRSIYWNEVPLLNEDGKYNFQQINVSYTPGTPDGSLLGQQNPELTVSRTLGERLRGSEIDSAGNPVESNDLVKYYRIYNPDCKGAVINVKVNQLLETVTSGKKFGDINRTLVEYEISYRPLYSNVSPDNPNCVDEGKVPAIFSMPQKVKIYGKITYGYIKSTRIDFSTDQFKQADIQGWEIQIRRITPDSISNQKRNQTFIDSLTEVYADVFTYPNSAIVRSRFNAEYFSQIPNRAYDTKLLKVKIPFNYDPISKTYRTEGGGTSNGFWDGTFSTLKQWTDNPAWCFYDILTNPRYGLGKYIDENFIDKWTLYSIGQYCDVLVSDGLGHLEPRFTCNLLLNTREEAYQVIQDFASIFRGLTYYATNVIFAVQDSPKSPRFIFTNANIEEGDFNYSSSNKKARHTVAIVRYNDKTNFYKPSIEYIEDIAGIKKYGIREIELAAFGCSSRGQAIRLGRWALLSETLETETISFVTSLAEGMILKPGDVFGVFDSNKKRARYAGRTNNIQLTSNSAIITLDNKISLDSATNYTFSLMTPTYNFDPANTDNLTSDDTSNINRTQIQTAEFLGSQTSTSTDGTKTIITFTPQPFDNTHYTVDGNLIWMLALTNGISTQEQSETFLDEDVDYFRTISVGELDINRFKITALQYNEQKYTEIEQGLNIERTISKFVSPPPPSNLNLILTPESPNTQIVDYAFVSDNYSGVTSYRVYASTTQFDPNPNVIPDNRYLISNLNVSATQSTFVPTQTGNHYFRIYSVNDNVGLISTGFASGVINVKKVDPILNISISSLTTSVDPTGNFGGTRYTGTYFDTDPEFKWQIGIGPQTSVPLTFAYRVTIRPPSYSNTPSSGYYYQETGIDISNEDDTKFIFSFDKNINTTGGPYREYDIVIEAHNQTKTSAGNTLNPLVENWSNPNGYDILHVRNDRPSGITLNSGIFNPGYFRTRQDILSDGSINIIFETGVFPQGIEGGFLYFSKSGFNEGQVKSGTHSDILTGEFTFDKLSQKINYPANLVGMSTGYIALSFYDTFDKIIRESGRNIFYPTGGYRGSGFAHFISPVTFIVGSGWLNILEINDRLTIKNLSNFSDKQDFQVRRVTQGATQFVECWGNTLEGSGVRYSSVAV